MITTTIAVMVPMKENSAILNTKPVHRKNLLVKISNAFEVNIVAMAKMIAVIIPMKLDAIKRKILHA